MRGYQTKKTSAKSRKRTELADLDRLLPIDPTGRCLNG